MAASPLLIRCGARSRRGDVSALTRRRGLATCRARDSGSFGSGSVPLPAQAWRRRSTRGNLVPMSAQMGETAVTPTLPEAGTEQQLQPTVRERLGITAFLLVAMLATAAWIALLAWGAVSLLNAF